MKKITIKRSSEWNNRGRKIGVYIDGEKVGVIKNGEIKEFIIEEGSHKIKAQIDWCGSNNIEFDISNNFKGYFELSGFKYANWLMPLVGFLTAGFFLPRAFGNKEIFGSELEYIFILLVSPMFLYLVYYLTIGRNKYLQLKLKK